MLKPTGRNELTLAELKTFEGYEDLNDEEAEEIIVQLREFSIILYSLFQHKTNENNKSTKE